MVVNAAECIFKSSSVDFSPLKDFQLSFTFTS